MLNTTKTRKVNCKEELYFKKWKKDKYQQKSIKPSIKGQNTTNYDSISESDIANSEENAGTA